jgi:hypothetical protein
MFGECRSVEEDEDNPNATLRGGRWQMFAQFASICVRGMYLRLAALSDGLHRVCFYILVILSFPFRPQVLTELLSRITYYGNDPTWATKKAPGRRK